MLLIGLAGTELAAHERDWLRHPGVAGVILFSRNYADRDRLIALVEAIREAGGEHALVAVDQEGGRVQRFRDGFTRLPALARIGAAWDSGADEAIRLAEEHAWIMASELRACGVDFSFAPVADLDRGSAAIGDRAFHQDPAVTGELVQAYVRGMHLAGMAAVLKHFPGHGSVAADTHTAQAIDRRPFEAIEAADLRPFAQALEAHAEAVMMAHVIYPAVDAVPAGFSPVWIERILRGQLGFAGVVVSDDISMAAAGTAGGIAARVRGHLEAGCDLVLACHPEVVEEALTALPADAGEARERLAPLRGAVGAGWEGLLDNPQRDRFIARVCALDPNQGSP